jgi:alpha-tubulin suppressor-like RCC1 family protein
VAGPHDLVAVTGGKDYSAALSKDGSLLLWGRLNDLFTPEYPRAIERPEKVKGLGNVIAISGGLQHILVLKKDGTVWAWGNNWDGQVGNGTMRNAAMAPSQVKGLSGMVATSAGGCHSMALKKDGSVWVWGSNQEGQMGPGGDRRKGADVVPTRVPGLRKVRAIDAGGNHCLALMSDGTVRAWGRDWSGQLGRGRVPNTKLRGNPYSKTPVRVRVLADVKAISAGDEHSLALKSDGTVWEWGIRVGLERRYTPQKMKGLKDIAAINADGQHSLAIARDGTLWVWGNNCFGQLGNGRLKGADYTPAQVVKLSAVTMAACGYWHTLAVGASLDSADDS